MAQEYFLYLDESGTFRETSTDTLEQETELKNNLKIKKKITSQLVGFLVKSQNGLSNKTRADISDQARAVIRNSFRDAKVNFENHAKNLEYSEINRVIPNLVKKLKKKQWQPVRLVNKEKITYGSRVSIYTNMVAELIIRIFQGKSKGPHDPVSIYLISAYVQLDDNDKTDSRIDSASDEKWKTIKDESYRERIEEALGFAAVRRGLTKEQVNWKLYNVKLADARDRPDLQICDLLSNASKDKYDKCSKENKILLQQSFGIFDQTMQTSDTLEQIDYLVERQALSSALTIIAENLVRDDETDYFKTAASQQLTLVLEKMIRIGSRGRDAHLSVLIAWLDQLIGQQRLLNTGYNIAQWLLENVSQTFRNELKKSNQEATIDWFDFSIYRWLLTAANHRGSLRDAQKASTAINLLGHSLARQSEHLPLLIDGLIVQSVHEADCFNFIVSINNLKKTADLLRLQNISLFKLLPLPPSEPFRSEALAKTLGTLTMSLILAGFENESQVADARKISDEAIEEFARIQDKERQYQYRCHLETLAGDFNLARRFLMKSLRPIDDSEEISHEMLWQEIDLLKIEQSFKYFFTLSHWLRIGALASRKKDTKQNEEFDDFYSVFKDSSLTHSCLEESFSPEFPAHLILKNLAVIESSCGQVQNVLKLLQRLDKITELNKNYLLLPTIQIAAFAEVAANLGASAEALSLIDIYKVKNAVEYKVETDIKTIIQRMLNERLGTFQKIFVKVQSWQKQINSVNFEQLRDVENQKI